MDFKYSLGVDISKDWFHVCLMGKDFSIVFEERVLNRTDEILAFITELLEQFDIAEISDVFLCMEHTGLYIQNLVRAWTMKGGKLAAIAANKISSRLAGDQGWMEKSDFLDARRIAEYGIRFSDKLECYNLKSHTVELLQRLQRQRDRLKTALHMIEVPVRESKGFDSSSIVDQLQQNQVGTIQALKEDLKGVEALLMKTIHEDPQLNRIFKLITSVKGVGPVISVEVIVTTECFTKFSPDNGKKFSKYAGFVPMQHSSGSSVRKKPRTSKRANSKLKPLLTMGAMSLIGTKGELGEYYRRKTMEGKEHLSVINAMRNKLIQRIFAVVRNDTMYVPEYEYVR